MSNANKAKPENNLKLAGKNYNLVFDFKFLRRLQSLTRRHGIEVNPFSASFLNAIGPIEVHAIVWTLLAEKKPTVTADEIDTIIDQMGEEGLGVIGDAIVNAAVQSRAEQEEQLKSKKKRVTKKKK